MDYNARMYSPRLGRFTKPDTIMLGMGSQAYNRYSYVLNNPIMMIDPTGHAQVCIDDVNGDCYETDPGNVGCGSWNNWCGTPLPDDDPVTDPGRRGAGKGDQSDAGSENSIKDDLVLATAEKVWAGIEYLPEAMGISLGYEACAWVFFTGVSNTCGGQAVEFGYVFTSKEWYGKIDAVDAALSIGSPDISIVGGVSLVLHQNIDTASDFNGANANVSADISASALTEWEFETTYSRSVDAAGGWATNNAGKPITSNSFTISHGYSAGGALWGPVEGHITGGASYTGLFYSSGP